MIRKVLTMCLIVIGTVFTGIGVSANDTYDEYYKNTLSALGIMEDVDDTPITNGEFAQIIVRMIQLSGEISDTYFRDLPENHPYHDAITALAKRGYLQGDNNGRCYPDEEVSRDTVIAVVVRCLGYEVKAQSFGGWPGGYNAVASSLKLESGVSYSGQTVSKEQLSVILYNALISPTFGYASSLDTYEEGETLAKKLYSVVEKEGVITKNYYTGLDTEEGTVKQLIELDSETVNTGKTNAGDYLGYKIKAMVIDRDNEYTLISFAPHKDNKETVIDNNDIISVPDLFSIRYQTDGGAKIKSAGIDRNASVIYNYCLLNEYDKSDFQIETGNLRLIDNNGDDAYDVVFINEYEIYFVSGVDTSSGKIYDKYGGREIDTTKDVIIMNSHNYEIDMSAVSTGSVLSVYWPKTNGKVIVIVSDYEPINGMILSMKSEEGKTYITVNNEEYLVDNKYIAMSEKNGTLYPKLSVGREGTFYINSDKTISGFVISTGSEVYGYIKKLYIDEDEDKGHFEIYNQYGEFVSGTIYEKCKINDTAVNSTKDILSNALLFKNGKLIPQLVRFTVNNSNELTVLKLAEGKTPSKYTDADKLCFTETIKDGEMRPGGSKYAYKYLYDDETVIFIVPSEENLSANNKYSISNKVFTDGQKITLDLYDIGIDCIIGAGVIVDGKNSIDFAQEQRLTVVQSLSNIYDEEEGETVKGIQGYFDGGIVNLKNPAGETYFDGFKKGDIIRVVKNPITGRVEAAARIFTFDDAGESADFDGVIYHDRYAVKMPHSTRPIQSGYEFGVSSAYGNCIAKGKNTIGLTMDGGETFYASAIAKDAKFYLVRVKDGNVYCEPASIDSIVVASDPSAANGDSVLLNNRNALTREVYIIRNN